MKHYSKRKFIPRILLNQNIYFKEITLIDEDGKRLGTFQTQEALVLAKSKELDLYCIDKNSKPPICKILNYDRYRFTQQKRLKKLKQKKSINLEKSLRISGTISDNDLQIKIQQAIKFLKNQNKVKLTMRLRGREKYLTDFGKPQLLLFIKEVEEYGKLVKPLKLIGGRYQLNFEPKNK